MLPHRCYVAAISVSLQVLEHPVSSKSQRLETARAAPDGELPFAAAAPLSITVLGKNVPVCVFADVPGYSQMGLMFIWEGCSCSMK